MPLNSYVTLGRSGLRVSPFCLGAMTFGQDLPGFGSSVEESEAVLAHYLEQGGNFIDTANGYNRGHSEKIIGDFFREGNPLSFSRSRPIRTTVPCFATSNAVARPMPEVGPVMMYAFRSVELFVENGLAIAALL